MEGKVVAPDLNRIVLAAAGSSYSAIARQSGYSAQYVRLALTGRRRPSAHLRRVLRKLCLRERAVENLRQALDGLADDAGLAGVLSGGPEAGSTERRETPEQPPRMAR